TNSETATATHDYEMDPNVVNNSAYSSIIKQGLTSIPTMSLVLDKDEFWNLYEGDKTYQASVEIFYPDNTKEQFNTGLESHSHNRLKRSLKLNIKAGITSNIFKKAPLNAANAATTFSNTKIVLRAGNNRSWARAFNQNRTCYTRDEWYRASQLAVSGVGGRGNFVHLYVNGLYWGLYNPVERSDAGMLSNYFGGVFEDWMALDHDGVRHGDATRFNYLTTTLINQDMSDAANYAQLKEYLDVEKFCDYLIVTWMTGMTDWPNNNFHGGNRNNPAQPFMYFAWDNEWSWDNTFGSNQGAWVHPQFLNNTAGSSTIAKIWHSARKSSEFMQVFVDRVNKNCFNNGPLTDANSRARWATINNYINTAIIGESARWGDALEDGVTRTRDTHWRPEVNRVDGLMNGNVNRFINALVAQGYYPASNPKQQVVSFSLINANTDLPIRDIVPGETINLATLPTQNLNIRANTNPATVGSVKLALSGKQTKNQTENTAPYALFGESGGNYSAWVPAVGTYNLTATPYTASSGGGTAGTPLSISFSVINQSTPGQYSLSVAIVGNGTVTKSPNQATYASGTNVTLTATPASGYKFSSWSGAASGTANPITVSMTSNKSVTATFTTTSGQQQVVSFTLINASTDQPIRDLVPGDVINIATVKNLNIRANTNPATVGSVKFVLTGKQTKNSTEGSAPYALFGDNNSNYNSWTPAVGNYTLKATPYSSSGGGGTAGTPLTISFSVVNKAAAANREMVAEVPEPGNNPTQLLAYPSPSPNGRLRVKLIDRIEGPLAYTLVSATGAKLVAGELAFTQPTSEVTFDFSRQMKAAGLYYLQLKGNKINGVLKVMRQ
ncbi:MAG: CotH kinase family protein, partial [Bacteroidota bacterium]|nr:CotH kinase family protein [Bacteroidota bacterium]